MAKFQETSLSNGWAARHLELGGEETPSPSFNRGYAALGMGMRPILTFLPPQYLPLRSRCHANHPHHSAVSPVGAPNIGWLHLGLVQVRPTVDGAAAWQ